MGRAGRRKVAAEYDLEDNALALVRLFAGAGSSAAGVEQIAYSEGSAHRTSPVNR
jgi:hypothetical protein